MDTTVLNCIELEKRNRQIDMEMTFQREGLDMDFDIIRMSGRMVTVHDLKDGKLVLSSKNSTFSDVVTMCVTITDKNGEALPVFNSKAGNISKCPIQYKIHAKRSRGRWNIGFELMDNEAFGMLYNEIFEKYGKEIKKHLTVLEVDLGAPQL